MDIKEDIKIKDIKDQRIAAVRCSGSLSFHQ